MAGMVNYRLNVEAGDRAMAGANAANLADRLIEAEGVVRAERAKADHQTMDLGSIVDIVVNSESVPVVAGCIVAWLKAKRGVTIKIERNSKTGSLKAAATGLDAETAMRIAEVLQE